MKNSLVVFSCAFFLSHTLFGFDPSSDSSLKLWVSAEDLALSDGAKVSDWIDKSSHASHLTQTESTLQPTFSKQGLNGRASVYFNDHLFGLPDGSVFEQVADFDVFLVLSADTGASGYQTIFGADYNGDRHCFGLYDDFLIFYDNSMSPSRVEAPLTLATPYVVEFRKRVFDISISLNGKEVATQEYETPAVAIYSDYRFVGGDPDQEEYFKGNLSEMIFFDRVLKQSQREQLTRHLINKYAITP